MKLIFRSIYFLSLQTYNITTTKSLAKIKVLYLINKKFKFNNYVYHIFKKVFIINITSHSIIISS